MKSFIKSKLDNDAYIFTMAQAILHNYPNVEVEYEYVCRNFDETFGKYEIDPHKLRKLIIPQLDHLAGLSMSSSQKSWMNNIRYYKPDFVQFVYDLKLKPQLYITCVVWDDQLKINIKGPWIQTIWFEVPVLAIISESYTRLIHERGNTEALYKNLEDKINLYRGKYSHFFFGDMGTRRRDSFEFQHHVCKRLKGIRTFTGTSNMHIAHALRLKALGTIAHQWFQAHQQLAPLKDSQKVALEIWAQEFRGDLGIALSDTLGFDQFLIDFDMYFAKLFDGCRHDSGDPYEWTEKLIQHYQQLGIDPRTKKAIYSDGLNFEEANKIYEAFRGSIQTSFGIGTWLTNDGIITPLQIVIKMIRCAGGPVAKISDNPIKKICVDENYYKYLCNTFVK